MRHLPEIPNGTRIGAYKVGAELGRGGIAIVYEATHIKAPERGPLALKVAFRNNENRDKRFIREFERLRVMALPGVVRVHDAGTTDELIWYVMDQIEGQPMSRALAAAPDLDARIAIAVEAGAQMFDILAGIHRLGFIHRDIKPSNILIGQNNETHVLDFGLVRLQERGDTLTRAGRLVGTVAFMSPEQTTGLPLTPRSDIFSAGLVLYEGLVGPRQRPQKQEEWLGKMCLQQVVPMAIRDPRIPRALSSIVAKLLTVDPHARPSAAEAAKLLRQTQNKDTRSDWPAPPRFIGRTRELDTCMTAFNNQSKRLVIVEGEVGSGRRRLIEQVQRQSLLYGTPQISGICRPHISGGAVQQLLDEMFKTHADPEWRVRTAGEDVGPLLSMWPTLPLPSPPTKNERYTLGDVAGAAARTILRGVESVGLMVVVHRLDQVDRLTARVLQMLLDKPPDRLGVFATMEPRWASARAKKLVDHLVFSKLANRIRLGPVSGQQATEMASNLNEDAAIDEIKGCMPHQAVEYGLERLAARRGESRPTLPPSMAILGLTTFPLPAEVLEILHIDHEKRMKAGLLRKVKNLGFELADNRLRQRAQSMIANRKESEDALADALTRARIQPSTWGNIARHMMHGRNPHRALAPAIHAAVHATQTGRYNEARRWLIAIDPMKRDRKDSTYRALRFELSWARARTSLATDLSRLRVDLVHQARARAVTENDKNRCNLIEAELMVRQGKMDAAIQHLIDQSKNTTPEVKARNHVTIARILLDTGRAAAARNYTDPTKALGKDPQRALIGIDLALSEGRIGIAIKGCKQALARSTAQEGAPIRGSFLLRLGFALLESGDRVGATQAIHQARDLLVSHGHRARLAEAHLFEGILALGRGHARSARVRVDPVITTGRAFSSTRLMSLGWSLKLQIAAVMNDEQAARDAMDGRTATAQGVCEDVWRMALARWHRTQRNLDQAIKISDCSRTKTSESVALAIECASCLIAANVPEQARPHLKFASELSNRRGYKELHILARLLEGGTRLHPPNDWQKVLHAAKTSPWLELSMTALAMEGRRSLAESLNDDAREKFHNLLQRADHLDNQYHRVVAQEALVKL